MTARRLAAGSWASSAAICLAGVVLLVLGPDRPVSNDVFGGVGGLSFLLLSLAFATLGGFVAARLPENRIGWLFCAIGFLTALGMLAYQYANHGLNDESASLPGANAAAWLYFVESPSLCGLLAVSILLFPDGRLPSGRWKPAAYLSVIGMVGVALGGALRPGPLDDPFATVTNVSGMAGTRTLMNGVISASWGLMFVGVVLAAIAVRRRLSGSRGVERQRLKWVLAAGTVVAGATIAVGISWFIWPDGHVQARIAVMGAGFATFPVVAGVAILRHRLYDVDVVINRALVYAALTAVLAAAYVASVLLLQLVLSPSSDLAIAGSTLAVAALFQPARRRVQDAVDRHFYRHRYDAARTLERFGARLRDRVDLDALGGELRGVVTETMQPAHVSLWLRGGGQ